MRCSFYFSINIHVLIKIELYNIVIVHRCSSKLSVVVVTF